MARYAYLRLPCSSAPWRALNQVLAVICEGRAQIASHLAQDESAQLMLQTDEEEETSRRTRDLHSPSVVMLHTGGTMGLFGLAQRYPIDF